MNQPTITHRVAISVALMHSTICLFSPAASLWLTAWSEAHFHWSHRLHNV